MPSVTTRVACTERVRPLLVPLTVSGYVPIGVIVPLFDVVTVNVADMPLVGVGPGVALAPAGKPETVSPTGRVKKVPSIRSVKLVAEPCCTDALDGVELRAKVAPYRARV